MSLSANPRSASVLFPCLSLLSLALLAGCASPGPPHPPSLHLPELVSDLDAERVGNEVKLHWTTPAKTTDGLKVKDGMTAEVCRTIAASPAPARVVPVACTSVQRVPVKPGASEAVDVLPQALTADPQALLEYRVQTFNANKHSAGWSTPAFAAAGSPPPPVAGLRVEAREQGALLQWEPKDAIDRIELDRLLTSKPPAHTKAKAGSASKQPFASDAEEPVELRLLAEKAGPGDSPFRQDSGGTLDATARRGETYTYKAQRIRPVVLGQHKLPIRSEISPVVTVVMRDNFPPHVPAGLETIPGVDAASPSIDLSWKPNVEPDLAGYLVYRQEVGSDGTASASVRLTPAPILEPGFHDATVLIGHTYSYRVTAIDTTGNESAPGAAVQQELRQP
jgi:hypothetical protein